MIREFVVFDRSDQPVDMDRAVLQDRSAEGAVVIREFVLFDRNDQPIEWIDPYISHGTYSPGHYLVSTGFAEYEVRVPLGGRFEIRPRKDTAA